MKGIASMADVVAIERSQPSLPTSTYEMIRASAVAHAKAPALSFFLNAQEHTRPMTWSYESLFASPRPRISSALRPHAIVRLQEIEDREQ